MNRISEKELIEGLTRLKDIKPDDNWVIFCRQNLVENIKADLLSSRPIFKQGISRLSGFFRGLAFPRYILKPALSLFLIFGFIFSAGLVTVVKAKDSLPGGRLYPIKLALEQAQLLATSSAEQKAEIQSKIIATRLKEINQIIDGNESIEVKTPKVEEAVINLQQQLLTINDQLPKVNDAKKMVSMANNVNNQATQVQQVLAQAKAVLPSDRLAEASDTADKASTQALEVMVEKSKQSDTGISQEEVLAKLDEKIQQTEQRAKSLTESVNNSETSKKLPINAVMILDESDKALEQAKISLQQKDADGALQTVKAANEMIKSAEDLVASALPNDAAPASSTSTSSVEDSSKNSTTAPPVIIPSSATSSSFLEPSKPLTEESTTPSVYGVGIEK